MHRPARCVGWQLQVCASQTSVCVQGIWGPGWLGSFGFKEDLGKESVRWGKFQECICCFQEMTGSMVVNRVGGDTVGTVGGVWRDRSGHRGQNLRAGSRLRKPQARTRLIRVGFSKHHLAAVSGWMGEAERGGSGVKGCHITLLSE